MVMFHPWRWTLSVVDFAEQAAVGEAGAAVVDPVLDVVQCR
jgi:hypothetical protein